MCSCLMRSPRAPYVWGLSSIPVRTGQGVAPAMYHPVPCPYPHGHLPVAPGAGSSVAKKEAHLAPQTATEAGRTWQVLSLETLPCAL